MNYGNLFGRRDLVKMQVYGALPQTMMVCVDSYADKCITGSLYNSFLQRGVAFKSTIEMLFGIESMLEDLKMPQSFTGKRRFRYNDDNKEEKETVAEMLKEGKLATFSIKILFRQNAGWQGSVVWCEGKNEESFRSVLELLTLMDSALDSDGK